VLKTFPLFDPLKSFDPDSIWDADPSYQSSYNLTKSNSYPDATTDPTPTDATHLAHRLNAILRALNDLPRQARRLKRWEFKRDAMLNSLTLRCSQSEPRRANPWRPTRFSPMRPGLPPGWRERRIHEIDEVLKECHRLANDLLNAPDSS
jgi:hypothetical protein